MLINPANVPESPVEPDRVSLMFLAAVLAVAAGLGTASLRNSMDTTIRGSADVTALLGSPPLGNVPTMRTAVEIRKKRLGDLALVSGVVVALAVVILAVR